MSRQPASCPACGSRLVRFRDNRDDWFCDNCDHRWVQTGAPAAPPRPGVFISYARADARDFATRLAGDLRARGYEVWIDLEDIEKGGLWEVRIEQGIRTSSMLLAVMTAQSLREESVCRDEVVFALNEGKKVVPARADPSPAVRPTLLLARRNWIDFTAGYEQGLAALVRYLAGDESALCGPVLPTVTGVAPLDFSIEIARFSTGFTGRAWLARELDGWLDRDGSRALVLVGEPGVGKSAVAAWLSLTRPEVVGVHFCTHRNTRSLNPYEFIASLVGQLHARLPDYARAVEARHPEVRRPTASDAFRELVVEPARQIHAPPSPRLVVVDSLDESLAQPAETVLDVLVRQAPDLPAWLRVVATTRPEAVVLGRIRALSVSELRADQPANREDVRQFLRTRLGSPSLAQRLGGRAAAVEARLDELAQGNFLYARLALDALEEGTLSAEDVGGLSPGLARFYGAAFERRFPDHETYGRDFAPLLRVLAAARGPLSLAAFQRLTGLEPETAHRRLRQLRAYLRVYADGPAASYALFHKSLRDWLTNPDAAGDYWCDVVQGHTRLAGVFLADWRGEDYALRYLPAHLAASGRWDELASLLGDLSFLEAKAAAGLVFDLAGDFAEVRQMPATHPARARLQLLEEALRLDIHFLDRHPTCLFQCLWNQAWWYEGADAPAAGLAALLEGWRADRERTAPGRPWLRSLRPPPVRLGEAQRAILRGHEGGVRSVAFSPDGRRLTSASDDGTIRLWDAAGGAPLGCLVAVAQRKASRGAPEALSGAALAGLAGYRVVVASVAFSPDGRRLVSGAEGRTVQVWDPAGGTEVLCLRGSAGLVTSVAFSPDGRRIASGADNRTVWVWDAAWGIPLVCLEGHAGAVHGVAFSPDGRQIASGSADGTVRLWDSADGAPLATLFGHEGGVRGVAFSPDGRLVASGAEDGTVRVWDTATGAPLGCLCGHEGGVLGVAFAPDGRRVASGSDDGTVRVWDVDTGTPLACLRGHEKGVTGVAFSPDGARIASASEDRTVRLWDPERGDRRAQPEDHAGTVTSLAFSPRGDHLASALAEGAVRLWDAAGLPTAVLSGHEGRVLSVCFSPDGDRMVSGSEDRTVRVWDRVGAAEAFCLRGHAGGVTAVCFSPDGRQVASASWDRTARVWDLAGRCERLCLRGHLGEVETVAFSPDGLQVATGSRDRTVRLWDALAGEELTCLFGHTAAVVGVAFGPGGRVLSRSADGEVRVRDAVRGECLEVLKGCADIAALAAGLPWLVGPGGAETVVRERGGEAVMWFPAALDRVVTHPAGRAWAGAAGKHLYLFTLEGGSG